MQTESYPKYDKPKWVLRGIGWIVNNAKYLPFYSETTYRIYSPYAEVPTYNVWCDIILYSKEQFNERMNEWMNWPNEYNTSDTLILYHLYVDIGGIQGQSQ